jgi:putative DNA primase/helicase
MTQAQSASAAPSSAPAAQPTQRAQQIQRVLSQLEQRFSRSGDPLGPKRTLRNLDRIIKLDPWFRDRIAYNGLAEVVEWEGRRLRDEHVTSIRLAIGNTYGVEYGAESTQAIILETARQLIYHPVCDYLQGLLWDRVPRIDQFLSTHIGAEDTPLLRAISRAWFVSCVARAWGKGGAPVKVDTCLVLAGPQGASKSTAFRVLASARWFSDTPIDMRSKEAYTQLRGTWIWELAELAGMRQREAETVKAFLSAPTDRYRPPYGRNVVESHRQVVFVASTNEATFLRDPSGARRFWPVTVGKIDIEAIRRDRNMLWAEAMQAYRDGAVWWLSREQDAELQAAQGRYKQEDPWTSAIREWLPSQPAGVSVADVLEHAVQMDTDKFGKHHEMRVSGILGSLGYQRKRVRLANGRRVWRWVSG